MSKGVAGVLLAGALLAAGCVANDGSMRAGGGSGGEVAVWRTIADHQAWVRTEGVIAASERSGAERRQQRIVLENTTLVPAENRIDLEVTRSQVGQSVVSIESVAGQAAPLFGQIRADRLQQIDTVFGPLFYVEVMPMSGVTCVFAFQRLSPGLGSLPARAAPIGIVGQNCVESVDVRVALRPFVAMSIRPASVALDTAASGISFSR